MYNSTKLNIIYWNSQSIYHKSIEVFDYLINNNVDVALFSETWLKPNRNVHHNDFKIYRADRIE